MGLKYSSIYSCSGSSHFPSVQKNFGVGRIFTQHTSRKSDPWSWQCERNLLFFYQRTNLFFDKRKISTKLVSWYKPRNTVWSLCTFVQFEGTIPQHQLLDPVWVRFFITQNRSHYQLRNLVKMTSDEEYCPVESKNRCNVRAIRSQTTSNEKSNLVTLGIKSESPVRTWQTELADQLESVFIFQKLL